MSGKKFVKAMVVTISIIGAAAALVTWYLRPFNISPQTTVRCHYMGYACGNCSPQYMIDTLIGLSDHPGQYIGLDIDLQWQDAQQGEAFEKAIGICSLSFRYEFTGRLKGYHNQEHLVIEAESYRLDTIHEIWEECENLLPHDLDVLRQSLAYPSHNKLSYNLSPRWQPKPDSLQPKQ